MTVPLKVHGVDLSHYNSNPDFATARKNGLKFVYHKASEGTGMLDSAYPARRVLAEKAGLPFGAYHFARPQLGTADAVAEARKFLNFAQIRVGDLIPMLDLEDRGNLRIDQLSAWAAAFCDEVRFKIGEEPIIYTPFDLGSAFKDNMLWVARYNNSNTPPAVPKPWSKWDIWQFSNGELGHPKTFPGLVGKVDLNTFAPGMSVKQLRIPKPSNTQFLNVNVMHTSLQYSLSETQHEAVITKIFARAKRKKVAWITGTEAGKGAKKTAQMLRAIGKEYGYKVYAPTKETDCWVAVRADFMTGDWTTGYEPVIPSSAELYKEMGVDPRGKPRWGEKGVVWVTFNTKSLGRISVASAHYLTKSRRPGETHAGINHWEWNRRLGVAIGDWAIEKGKGSALAFAGADTNMNDQRDDVFFGAPLTTLADELGKHANTGHGPIDIIASYDFDNRVVGKSINVLDDTEFQLDMDHYVVEGVYAIRELSSAA